LFEYIIDFPCIDRARVWQIWCRLRYAD